MSCRFSQGRLSGGASSANPCNEPGAWRYLARRGAGSASKQLGANIQCPTTYCDRLPPGGTNDDRRGWEPHHIVPGGEGRNSENVRSAQAERAERYMYACDFRPNQPPNGVWLRGRNLRSPAMAYTNLSTPEKMRPNHAFIHTTDYFARSRTISAPTPPTTASAGEGTR